jgi:LL-diaminopimelate aminotransferase
MKINTNYENLEQSYLFSTIAKKVNEYITNNPDKKVIRLGIGDVTLPLCKAVTDALHKAVDEMGVQATFRGYGPEQGYDFLREAVLGYYKSHDVNLELDEIFISDGAKSDLGNILDLFDEDNKVLVPAYNQPHNDEMAIKRIQEAFPKHEIKGINCLPLIKQHGSLHCITMQFPANIIK